ncbi:5'-methylthioadenosine/S-adenosylhomocysteine nucleosidase [Desmospora profundinema]|uniref:5'-methylthioadenosine/S-adenosylhomocysteine nucleosidase n=1 Tax=Desmospora profundinema TaxID=1571184 RepID=A0ABU1IRV3_9BACL|nr:5'-methylthioadenosine/S-adenosylhomocysteine nucleosidase [Desmospora profundinema]MDR6227524.1 adenosylhomocysteine nucleosidase [Desmospora profundinema]
MKIGIIGAMAEEVDLLRKRLEPAIPESIADTTFHSGVMDEIEVVVLQSGIGKVNAAIGTTMLIQHYQPDYVINTGCAGGFHPDLRVGDVVISTEVRHHDVDATIFNYEYGQVPRMPAFYLPDPELVAIAEAAARTLPDLKVYQGLIASGDSFMSDDDRVAFVKSKFEHLYAVEMEAASIAQVCNRFKTPFVVIRSISDIAGGEAKMSYEQFMGLAAVRSEQIVLSMLGQLKERQNQGVGTHA